MKGFFGLGLIGAGLICAQAAAVGPADIAQPFTAVIWTTTTLHSPAGRSFAFVRRTVYSRDASGAVRREMYRPTSGTAHDTSAPLERVLTGSISALASPQLRPSTERLEQQTSLGTHQFSGVPATGSRQTYQGQDGHRTRTFETWFSPQLGMTVHQEIRDARGNSVVSNLSELQFGNPTASPAAVPVIAAPFDSLHLYRELFTLIAHMERDRLANDPNRPVNMVEIEDRLRKKIDLSSAEWKVLVAKSMAVQDYTREASTEAHSFALQDRSARSQNPLAAGTPAAGRATLHTMQQKLNTRIQAAIDDLKAGIGPKAAAHLETYLQGPLAGSTTRARLTAPQVQALRAQRGANR